jgi:hypothetical protein
MESRERQPLDLKRKKIAVQRKHGQIRTRENPLNGRILNRAAFLGATVFQNYRPS